MRLSNQRNGLHIDTFHEEYPGILKLTADRETYPLVLIHERTLQAKKKKIGN